MATGMSNMEVCREKLLMASLKAPSQQHINANLLVSLPDFDKSRRRSTIHSYTLSNYHSLPHDPETLRTVREMSHGKALKNVIVLGIAFMFIFTAFVSLQGLQSSLHIESGVGVFSLSSIYVGTIISCFFAPWIIQRFTTKWTMVITFVFFTGYFAGNFHPEHYMLIPLGALLGLLAGPLFSAQATSITTIALAYAEHSHISDQDHVINKFMGIFCGLYRTSNIWGNLITTLVINKNTTGAGEYQLNHSNISCGSRYCLKNNSSNEDLSQDLITTIDNSTKVMLLSIYMGCGVMGIVILISLFDQHKRKRKNHHYNDDELTSSEIFLSTLKMFKDSKCQLLILIVVFVGLEHGFMFSDFTQAYIACTLGVSQIGPIMMCFGAVSSISCILIGIVASRHIKRFAFIVAGATFNVGLLIVLWLWKPTLDDVPNFFVVAGCLGLCDAIWQTQTYTLFGVLFIDKQEAAFSCYRMLYATGCAIAFGYSYFLCVQTKVIVLAGVLILALFLYCVIEMKVQLQSQHIRDIVAL